MNARKRFWGIICLLLVFSLKLNAQSAFETAVQYVQETRSEFGLSIEDVAEFQLSSQAESKLSGITHLYLRQSYQGIGIYQGNLNISLWPDRTVLTMGNGSLVNIDSRISSSSPGITVMDAILSAASVYGLGALGDVLEIEPPVGVEQKALYSGGSISQENIPVKLIYFEDENDQIRLCWNLSILALDGQHWWSLRIDANTGQILDVYDWMLTCHWGKVESAPISHFEATEEAEPLALFAAPPPNSYNVYPAPVESPNHGSRQVVSSPWDLTASPFGWHDDDGVAGAEYTFTQGNNVLAQEDQNGDNGNGLRADGGPTLDFNFPININNNPNTYTDAALTNLFYWNNLIHDVWHRYGFDEPSGNFQENTYGRGGAGGDLVLADGQDGGGINNANFGTPDDGQRPRMQMFLWNLGASTTVFEVNTPPVIAGQYPAVEASFGPALTGVPITANLVLANDGSTGPVEACNPLINGAAMAGNIALIDRGNCPFIDKVNNAQNAGAVACVVCQNTGGGPFSMTGPTGPITIPSVMISQADCNLIKAQMGGGVNVSLSSSGTNVNQDGDLDNGIIAHEYGHGISNRLVGGRNNTNCLNNAEQMGEGWSDFIGLMMTIEPGDQGTDSRGIGTFAISEPVTGNGIRPAPYSTNLATNGFTYGDIGNFGTISQPHGIGFLWCNMLWEMNWSLIAVYGHDPDLHTGSGGNNIAMNLVTEGMKLIPCNPGFVDGRDAILQADQALYGGIHQCLIWSAFAKRGLGFGASQGSTSDRTDGAETFAMPPSCNLFPVEWMQLSAEAGAKTILVNWTLGQETQNRGFEVHRRAGFEDEFRKVDWVQSRGDSQSEVDYGYLDEDVQAGIRYEYRLLQVDINGESSFSNTVAATIAAGDELQVQVFPNPVLGRAELRLSGAVGQLTRVRLYNLMGQEVFQVDLGVDAAHRPIELDLSGLSAGHYLLKIQSDEASFTEKIVKQ